MMWKGILLLIVFAANTTLWSQFADHTEPVRVTVPGDSVIVLHDTMRPVVHYALYSDSGVASWYGKSWKGRMTASGEFFHPDSLTAAHKWLPFGTIVRITNPSNDSVTYVRITDRLPKSSSRSIDVTPAAAKKLGFYSRGIQKVKMESCGIIAVRKKTTSCGPGRSLAASGPPQ